MIIIVLALRLDLLKSLIWVVIASFLGVLYDVDHLLYGLYLGKVKIIDVLKNPLIVLRIRRATGVLPEVPTHNIFIALLISLLAGIAVPDYAIPIGIGLTFHIMCDYVHEKWLGGKEKKMKDIIKRKSLSLVLLTVFLGVALFKIFSGANVTQLQAHPITGFAVLPILNAMYSIDSIIYLSIFTVLFSLLFYEISKKK
jgi:hypothetical protein